MPADHFLFARLEDASRSERLQRVGQFFAAVAAERNRFRQNIGELMRALLLVIEPVLQLAQLVLLRPDEKPAQFIQLVRRVSRR